MPTNPTESKNGGFGDTPPHGQPAVRLGQRGPQTSAGEAPRAVAVPPPPGAGHRGEGRQEGNDAAGRVRVTRDHAARVAHRPGARAGATKRRRARFTRRGRLLLAVLALLLVLAGAVAWYEVEANPSGAPGKALVINVRHGEAVGDVLSQLTRDGVIGSAFAFRLWAVVHGEPTVLPGRYLFHRNLPFAKVARLLGAGPNVFEVDVLPGTTLAEVSRQLSPLPGHLAERFSREARSGSVRSPFGGTGGTSLEGLIGSGLYQVLPGETAHTLLDKMVERFTAQAQAAGLKPTSGLNGLSAYELVTVASIAQKEGYFTRYMGDVARVIYNRLAQGMHLDMTSTVLYSLGQDGGPVTPAEEQKTTPYNTYLHAGLTPTPICVPSPAALKAAVAPPAGPWLYFELVTAKKGRMVFSATFTGQLNAEKQAAANG